MAKRGGGGLELSGPGLKMLRKLHKRVNDLAQVKKVIAATQSEEAIDLTKQGFVDEVSPYGKPWKKRKRETKKTRGRKVLSGQTSRLKGGWHVTRVSGAGFKISPSVAYAVFHQKPRKGKRPKRGLVPDTGRFPRKWRRPMNEAATEAITDFLTG